MLRRLLPKSLFQRAFLIIVLPVAAMQAIVTFGFFERHWTSTTQRLAASVAGDVAFVMELWKRGDDADALAAMAEDAVDLSMAFRPGESLPSGPRNSLVQAPDASLRAELRARLDDPFWVDATRYPAYVEIRVAVDGGVIRFLILKDRAFAETGYVFVIWLVGATLTLLAVAAIFLRNQVKPIVRLARAAEEFGKGRDVEGFKPAGAMEVRRAAAAFIKMRARIKRHLAQRTVLLAGVGHDLRTPLTRLKLELAMLGDHPARASMAADLEDMERLLEDYLDFARDQTSAPAEPTDLTALLQEAALEAAAEGAVVEVDAPSSLTAPARAVALRRCVVNLICNAARHAKTVKIAARAGRAQVEITIDDDGPGIPADMRTKALKPFRQLDAKGSGVAGLGLAIARDIALAHGGALTLEDAPIGGLRCRLTLPA